MDENLKAMLGGFLQLRCGGKARAVKSYQLQELFGCKDVDVRSAVNRLRVDGVPIGSGNTGYYYCVTEEELAETLKHLYRRIKGIKVAIDGLEQAKRGMANATEHQG